MTAAEIAVALDGRHEGRGWRCRCPAHGGHSLVISDGRDGCVTVRCWGGCPTRDVFAALRRLGLLDGEADGAGPDPAEIARRREDEARDRLRKIALAMDIWRASYPAGGTVVERYLAARGITLPPPPTLRHHPMYGCYGRHLSGSHRPQMVALVEHVEHGPVAVSRTFLCVDGSNKASVRPPRLFTGSVKGAAVRLARAGDLLMVSEGIETGLSAQQACGLPCWAALSAGGIQALVLPPLPLATTIVVLADNDNNGAGERAARAAAQRWLREGRRVRLAMPPTPGDFNDVLMGRAYAHVTKVRDVAA